MFRNLSTVGLPLSGRPSELIEMALSFGFDSMDLDLVDFQQQAKVYGAEHAQRLMVSTRLSVGVFVLPVALGGDEETIAKDMAELEARLDLAQEAEATRAVATVEASSDDFAFKDNFERYRTRLQSIGELLEPRGISLGLAVNPDRWNAKRRPTASCTRLRACSAWWLCRTRRWAWWSILLRCTRQASRSR